VSRKFIFRILSGLLALTLLAAGIFLLSPVFDSALNKLNGIAFIVLSIVLARFALTGKERVFRK
jgi:hypothetical protein